MLNRLKMADLPAGVSPDISPRSPTGEIFRYVLVGPKAAGRDLYDPNDLKSLEDNTLERLFRRIPRVADVTSYGASRYACHRIFPPTHRLRIRACGNTRATLFILEEQRFCL